jgi:hypothetical protein
MAMEMLRDATMQKAKCKNHHLPMRSNYEVSIDAAGPGLPELKVS